ncbi:MAG: hypothetical protein QOH03_5088 [Kribbellaceae bacterium]|jgi:hypothetical protein|nr:hypothetical protein [Kribbellaceae bacterium]
MTRWLWPANLIATLVTAAATIAQPVLTESVPMGPNDDPHGYVLVFSIVLALGVLSIVAVAFVLLARGKKAGMATSLAAAVCCAGVAALTEGLLPDSSSLAIIGIELIPVTIAILGLSAAPAAKPRPKPTLTEPPYPTLSPQ